MWDFFAKLISKLFFFTGKIESKQAFLKPLDSAEEARLFELMKTGSKEQKREAENKLAEHNLRLVAHIAKKYKDSKLSTDELSSIGSVGLVKAIRTYSPEKANFSTYASRCIANEILMFFRADKKNGACVSLEDPVGFDKDGNNITLVEVLSTSSDSVEKEAFARVELDALNKQILSLLDKREQNILALRYGLYGQLPHTQKEVAKLLNISRSYVSRIETSALEKIRR